MTESPEFLTFWQYCVGCAIIIVGNIIINIFSKRSDRKNQIEISQKSAELALEKVKMEWAHEKDIDFESQFTDAISSVALYSLHKDKNEKDEAIAKLNIVRVKASGNLASTLDNLYFDIDSDYEVPGDDIRKKLALAIESYRNQHRQNAAAKH